MLKIGKDVTLLGVLNNYDKGKNEGEISHGSEPKVELNEKENKILEKMSKGQTPNLQSIDRIRLMYAMKNIDRKLLHVIFSIETLEQISNVLKVAGNVVAPQAGAKTKTGNKRKNHVRGDNYTGKQKKLT